MTGEKDFEALGRYVDAKETIERLVKAREQLGAKIRSTVDWPGMSDAARRVEVDALHDLADQMAAVDCELARAVETMNHYAAAAGRKPYKPF